MPRPIPAATADIPSWARPRPKEQIGYRIGCSALGQVLVATSASGVAAILLGDDSAALVRNLQRHFPDADLVENAPATTAVLKKVIAYIAQPVGTLNLPLDLRGTTFQRQVWEEVRKVPAGQTSSYSEIARRVGADKAIRAVGTTCALNRHALAIPCHRIFRKDGTFSGGEFWLGERHRLMMEREMAAIKEPRS